MFARLRIVIGAAISLLFLALLFWQAKPAEIIDALRGADYLWLLPAVVIFIAAIWVRAIRYQQIMRTLRTAPARELFPVLVVGYMANNLLPLRIGDLVRAYLLGERFRISKMASLGTTAVERLFDGLTLLAFLAATVVILGASGTIHDVTLIAVGIFAVALAVFVGCLISPDGSEALVARLARPLPERLRARILRLAVSFIEGLRSLRHPDAIAWVVGTSLVAWLLEAVVYLCVGRAFGLDINAGYYLMAVGAGNLALTAPSSPGGAGPFEFVVTRVLMLAGIDEPVATAYAFTAHFTVLIPATLLGLYYLWSMHLSLGLLSRRAEGAMEHAIDGDAGGVGRDGAPARPNGDLADRGDLSATPAGPGRSL